MKFLGIDLIANTETVVWDISGHALDENVRPEFLCPAYIYRIYRKHHERFSVILYAPINTAAAYLFLKAVEGDEAITHLAIHYAGGRHFDRYDADNWIVTLNDCELKREWVKRPVAAPYEDGQAINLWIELGCDVKFNLEWEKPCLG